MSYTIATFFTDNPVHFTVFVIEVAAIITLAALALRGSKKEHTGDTSSDIERKFAKPDTQHSISTDIKTDAAVLYIDLKDFHKLSGKQEPEIIVSVLNQFFETTGDAIMSTDGWIDSYMGDGLLAVFGHDTSPDKGVKSALKAITLIRKAMPLLNKKLSNEFGASLQIGIGLHVGPLLTGPIGHHSSETKRRFIGPAINTVSKLEEVAKEKGVQVVISAEAAKFSGMDIENELTEFVILRDDNIPVEVLCIPARKELPSIRA